MFSISFREKQHRKKQTGALAFQIKCATGHVSRDKGSAEWETLLTEGLRSPRAKQTIENTAIKVKRDKPAQRPRKLPGSMVSLGVSEKRLGTGQQVKVEPPVLLEIHCTLVILSIASH